MINYGFSKTINEPFDNVLDRVKKNYKRKDSAY